MFYRLLNGRTWKHKKRIERIKEVSNRAKIVECVSLLDIVYLTSACLHFIIKIVFVNLRQIFKVRKIIVCLSTITRGMICLTQPSPQVYTQND